jgi:Na+/proline symporter/signal transduction histidine kinase
MFDLQEVVFTFLIYMLFLFIIAYIVEKKADHFGLLSSPYIYSLSLAVFCTAWTYYGSVGKVSSGGMLILAVYLGPTLIVFLWPILLRRLIRIKQVYKVTSLADLISVRYNKSMIIGAFVSFGTLVGIIPYISIQLKAIIQSINILIIKDEAVLINDTTSIDNVGLLIVALMSFFTIIFGLRKLDPSERHFAMIFIVAVESIIKLLAIIIIGIFVSYFVFDDISSILSEASAQGFFKDIGQSNNSVDYSSWITLIILSMFAVMFLPRQFHVSVVENSDVNHIKTAMWVFPLYLLLITFFTIPIALAGSLLNINHELNDFYVLTIPLSQNQPVLSLIAFIGGFSASTSMIMITAMTMSIMVSNYFILPLIQAYPILNFLKKRLLLLRWFIVTIIIFISYIFYLYIAKTNLIVNIGLISFTAILQFVPVILGGLFWEKANRFGAMTALLFGFAIWFYTLILPQFEDIRWIAVNVLNNGFFGIVLFNPTALFGMVNFSPIPHAVFWSMIFNISAFVLVSLFTKSTDIEKKISVDFINILKSKNTMNYIGKLESNIDIHKKLSLFEEILNQYLKTDKTKLTMEQIRKKFNVHENEQINIMELSKLYGEIERILSGTLGTAVAYSVLKNSDIFTEDESSSLSNMYTNILKDMKISPDEFSRKINYLEEKDKLLNEHYEQLKEKIVERDEEINAKKTAEKEILTLNDTLEHKVEDRTKKLKESNQELKKSMDTLKKTQDTLIETEKMASLGELVAGVAHEINTPIGLSLTGITHFITKSNKISKLYDNDELNEEDFQNFIKISQELATSININLEKTANLVRSFKQVAVDQSSDGKREFELVNYLNEILLSINNITKKTKVKINIDAPKSINIKGYPGAISQIFTNLIMNTLKHGYDKIPATAIDIQIKEKDENIEMIYKDYGHGISEKNLTKIFNPFFTTKRDDGGSGLGLSIIYNLITTKLNGTIQCESVKEKGTTFSISMPKEIK